MVLTFGPFSGNSQSLYKPKILISAESFTKRWWPIINLSIHSSLSLSQTSINFKNGSNITNHLWLTFNHVWIASGTRLKNSLQIKCRLSKTTLKKFKKSDLKQMSLKRTKIWYPRTFATKRIKNKLLSILKIIAWKRKIPEKALTAHYSKKAALRKISQFLVSNPEARH